MEPLATLLNRYTRVVRPDDNGTFVAYLPAIPGCHAIGDSPAEAEAELESVFGMIVEECSEQGRPLPPDVPNARRESPLGRPSSDAQPEYSVS